MASEKAFITTAVTADHGVSTRLRAVDTVRINVAYNGYYMSALFAGLLHLHSAWSTFLPAALEALVCAAGWTGLRAVLGAVDDIVGDRMAEHQASVATVELCIAWQSATSIRAVGEIFGTLRLYFETIVFAALQR